MTLWVVDTAPLIFLAKLDRLYLLKESASEVIVPPAVIREVNAQVDDATQQVRQFQQNNGPKIKGVWAGYEQTTFPDQSNVQIVFLTHP